MKVKVELFLELKFKFSQILLGDKNTTYLSSKIISTLISKHIFTKFKCQTQFQNDHTTKISLISVIKEV